MNRSGRRKILVLASAPDDQSRLRADVEIREIAAGLRSANQRDGYELVSRLAVRPRDLQQALIREKPQIVHFSGHGSKAGAIWLENDFGRSHPVSPDALADLFDICSSHVECVLLNACYAEAQANVIAHHIHCVIGMATAISDNAAVRYAVGFYDALGTGMPFQAAHRVGCNLLRLENIPEHLAPVIKTRPGGSCAETDAVRLGQMSRGEIESVIQEYKRALVLNDMDGDAHHALGLLYLQLRLYDLALRHFKRSIDLDPSNADAYYYLALAAIRGRRPKCLLSHEVRAIEAHVNTALQLDGRQAKYYYLLAVMRSDYYASNGLSCPSPSFSQLLSEAQGKDYDAWEVERLLQSLSLRDEELISRIRRT